VTAGVDVSVLTPQQRRIVGLYAEGYSAAEIAAELSLQGTTVAEHMKRARARLGHPSRREIVAALMVRRDVVDGASS
jgi:DNA-binding CsgD family transcriptional regulator